MLSPAYRRSSAVAVTLILLLGVVPSVAAAGPATPPAPAPPVDTGNADVLVRAREAFQQGAELAKAEHWAAAIAAFEVSYRLKPHPVTIYDIGFCERGQGNYTRARQALKRALTERDGTEVLPSDLVALAQGYLAEVETALAHVPIEVDAAGATLLIDGFGVAPEAVTAPDGTPLLSAGTGAAGTATPVRSRFQVLVNPGQHTFVISYPDGPTITRTVAVAKGERAPLLTATQPPKAKTTVEAPPAVAPDHTWAYVAFGVGAAGLVAGGITGTVALSKKFQLNDECGPSHQACPNRDGINSLNTFADVSTASFIVGAVGVGVGVGLYVWGSGASAQRARSATSIRVGLMPNRLHLSGEF